MNIVFMGTPDFAVPSLKAIIDEFGVKAVLTQPDRPKGRGKALGMSPIKELAIEYDIPVYQPEKLRKDEELISKLKSMELDFIIVVAYGQILSKDILDIPKFGCINLHGSLLPKYRGAAPVHHAILNGERESGNTTMLMDEGLDTGDMLLKENIYINENMTSGELYDILKKSGAELLVRTIKGVFEGNISPEKQGESSTCYASMLHKKMGNIQWSNSCISIHNKVRGLNPFPMAYTHYKGVSMKLIESITTEHKSTKVPGTIVKVDKSGMRVATEDRDILITKIQFPNKKPLTVEEYTRGNDLEENEVLHQ